MELISHKMCFVKPCLSIQICIEEVTIVINSGLYEVR